MLFLVLEHVLLVLKAIIAFVIPDVPEEIEDLRKRQAYLISKVVKDEADEADEVQEPEHDMPPNLSVKLTDLVPDLSAERRAGGKALKTGIV